MARRLFEEAEAAAGPIDIVVANAAVFLAKPLAESTEEDYEQVFAVNTKGVFFTLQEAARRVRDGGRIIAVSTCGTRLYFPHASLYLGSKGAVEQFVRTLSRELGSRRITVNALAPGFTDTDMLHDDQARALGVALALPAPRYTEGRGGRGRFPGERGGPLDHRTDRGRGRRRGVTAAPVGAEAEAKASERARANSSTVRPSKTL